MKAAEMPLRAVGRPLSFDRNEALRKAMVQFWETGYETTSVADLTRAMGITPPSLYAAFGDKEQLFLEALGQYASPEGRSTAEAIGNAPSARAAAERLLRVSAEFFTQRGMPAGCLVASAASTGSAASKRVRLALRKVRTGVAQALERRVEAEVFAGVLPADTHAKALAGMTVALIQGMSTLARDGATRGELLAVVDAGMRGWPENS